MLSIDVNVIFCSAEECILILFHLFEWKKTTKPFNFFYFTMAEITENPNFIKKSPFSFHFHFLRILGKNSKSNNLRK